MAPDASGLASLVLAGWLLVACGGSTAQAPASQASQGVADPGEVQQKYEYTTALDTPWPGVERYVLCAIHRAAAGELSERCHIAYRSEGREVSLLDEATRARSDAVVRCFDREVRIDSALPDCWPALEPFSGFRSPTFVSWRFESFGRPTIYAGVAHLVPCVRVRTGDVETELCRVEYAGDWDALESGLRARIDVLLRCEPDYIRLRPGQAVPQCWLDGARGTQ